jgi:hypothetical protein
MELKEKIKVGLKDAIASKGKNKGMLKAKCPPMNTYGSAVWQGIMSVSNPYKVGLGHMLFMDSDKMEVYKYIREVSKHIDLSTFDKDGNVLRELGLM